MLLPSDPAHCFMPYPAVEVPCAPRGPLSGLTFAVKDLFDVAGYPTSGGKPARTGALGNQTRTAPAVQKLLDAGAHFVGKTITDELAFSMTGSNAHFGTPRNGAAPERIPGGSSSGSASAVSNKLCDFALGTDTGARCARRPTTTASTDCARRTAACRWRTASTWRPASIAAAISRATRKPSSASARRCSRRPLHAGARLRTAAGARLFRATDAEVAAAFAPLLQRIAQQAGNAAPGKRRAAVVRALYWSFRYVQGYEAWRSDGALIEDFNLQLGPGVKERFAWSKEVSQAQYAKFSSVRDEFATLLAALLDNRRALLLPTMPDIAPRLDEPASDQEDYRNNSLNLLSLAGLARLPQVSLPLASRLGAPLGLSLIGPTGSDLSLIRLALTLTHCTGSRS